MKRVISLLAVFAIVAVAAVPASAHPIHHGHFIPVHRPVVFVGGPVVTSVVAPVVTPVVVPVCVPDYMSFIRQGDAWNSQGKFGAAIASYSQAIALDPTRPVGFARRAAVWTEEGKTNMALADNSQASALIQSVR